MAGRAPGCSQRGRLQPAAAESRRWRGRLEELEQPGLQRTEPEPRPGGLESRRKEPARPGSPPTEPGRVQPGSPGSRLAAQLLAAQPVLAELV